MINIDIYAAIILIMKRGQDKLCHLLGIYTVHQKMLISCVYMDFITYEEGGGHFSNELSKMTTFISTAKTYQFATTTLKLRIT